MRNSIYIVLAIVAIALIAWFFLSPAPVAAPLAPAGTASSAIGASAGTGETVKTGMPAAVGKTNPFQSDVNPISGYQNPFGK